MASAQSSAPPTTFRVLVLGPFALYRAGVPVDTSAWPRRAQSLFRMLATAPGRRRPRDEVIDRLWPDATPQAGASNLRYTLHLLRRTLGGDGDGPSPLLSEHGWVALNPAYAWDVDLDRFDTLARTAGDDATALEQAATLYREEPLLEDRYEEWAAPLRQRIARAYRDVCLRLAARSQARGAYDVAAQWFERVLQHDPLDEEALQHVLVVLGELGRRTDALRRYHQFERRLADELAVSPTPETLAIVARLKAQSGQPAAPPGPHDGQSITRSVPILPSYPLPTTGPLVGRDAEVRAITGALTCASGKAPRLFLVSAEAGMGKTRLLGELARRARDAGALTLAGGCYEQEGRLPYGPLHDALADYVRVQPEAVLRTHGYGLLAEVARVVPELRARLGEVNEMGRGTPDDQRLRLFSAVAQLLGRIAATQPLVVLLDDLQWADASTLQLMHFLVRQTDQGRLLIVGTYRQEEVAAESPLAALVAEVERTGAGRHLALRPLSDADLGTLLERRLGGRCERGLSASLHERSGGNPFFAQEMARLLQQEQRLVRAADGWRIVPETPITLPPAVRETITRRLRPLAPQWRAVLAHGAVLGRAFAYAALEAAWEGDEQTLLDALDAALGAQLLSETETGYLYRHPLLREVLYERLPAPRRMLLHGRAGLALERVYGRQVERHAAEVAHHFAAAGPDHRDRAVRYLTIAGDAAAQAFATDEALALYHRALHLTDRDENAVGLHERLGDVEAGIGRAQDALDHYRAAEALMATVPLPAPSGQRGGLALKLARQLTLRRELTAADQAVDAALRLLPADDAAARSAAFAVQALGRIYRGDYAGARSATERALELADASGVPDRVLEALTLVAHPSITVDGPHVTALLRARLPLLKDKGHPSLHAEATMLYVWHRLWVRGVFGADEAALIAEARDVAARTGAVAAEAHASMVLGAGQLLTGEWRAAMQNLLRMLELTAGLDRPPSPQGFFFLGTLCLARGQVEEAHAYLMQGLAQLDNWYWVEPPHGGIWLHQALAEWCVAAADRAGMVQALAQAEEAAARLGCVNCTCLLSGVAADAWATVGEPERAQAAARRALALAEPLGRDASRGMAERALAQCALPDRLDEVLAHGRRAVEIFQRLGQPYELARSLRVLGSVLSAAGRHGAAHDAWHDALTIAERLEAAPEVGRLRELLARPGH